LRLRPICGTRHYDENTDDESAHALSDLFRSKDERCLDELPHLSSADFGRRVAEL
jgi:hypothetical protein